MSLGYNLKAQPCSWKDMDVARVDLGQMKMRQALCTFISEDEIKKDKKNAENHRRAYTILHFTGRILVAGVGRKPC